MNKLSKRAIDKIILFLNDKEFNYVTLSKREVKILFNVYQNATSEIFQLEEQLQIAKKQLQQENKELKEDFIPKLQAINKQILELGQNNES